MIDTKFIYIIFITDLPWAMQLEKVSLLEIPLERANWY